MLPFTEENISNNEYVRIFDEKADPIEFKWHRDGEDRLIECFKDTDWLFQKENELPISFKEPIFIKKHGWHRLIKGNDVLTLKITKYI